MELLGDRVVGRGKPGCVDVLRRQVSSLGRIAELADEVDVLARVDEGELVDGGGARGKQVGVLDQARRLDQVDGELDANRLQRVLVGQVVLHERVAVHKRDLSRHGHLR